METKVTAASNDLNPREHSWTGNPMVCSCGSCKLAGEAGLLQYQYPELPVVCGGEGEQHRCWCTAHEPALCGSTALGPLHLFNEGLTQPFGYWGHSVSLGPLNTGGEGLFPPELQMASFVTSLILGLLSPLGRVCCLHLQTGNLNHCPSGLSSDPPL